MWCLRWQLLRKSRNSRRILPTLWMQQQCGYNSTWKLWSFHRNLSAMFVLHRRGALRNVSCWLLSTGPRKSVYWYKISEIKSVYQMCECWIYFLECVCNILGTNRTAGPCDRNTGQCHCLKNVIGKQCDVCEDNHWKIASGEGCEACDCDEVGSLAPQCNSVSFYYL